MSAATGRDVAAALVFDRVTKAYSRGAPPALAEASFRVPTGGITGLVGHNGAGKTTAFSLVSGFLRADAGSIDILGKGPFDPHRLKGLIGVLPQDAELPDRHTPRELLRHLARLQGLGRASASTEVDRVLDAVQLSDRRDARIATLSHGMRRRVAVATALVGSPLLVLLDEPLSGLDPVQAHALRRTLAGIRGRQTLVVSSHDLDDLERMSDWVVMLAGGRCVRQGTVAEITGRSLIVRWELAPGADLDAVARALAAAIPGHAFRADVDTLVQTAPADTTIDALDRSSVAAMTVFTAHGVAVRGIRRGMGLEQRFLADVSGAGVASAG